MTFQWSLWHTLYSDAFSHRHSRIHNSFKEKNQINHIPSLQKKKSSFFTLITSLHPPYQVNEWWTLLFFSLRHWNILWPHSVLGLPERCSDSAPPLGVKARTGFLCKQIALFGLQSRAVRCKGWGGGLGQHHRVNLPWRLERPGHCICTELLEIQRACNGSYRPATSIHTWLFQHWALSGWSVNWPKDTCVGGGGLRQRYPKPGLEPVTIWPQRPQVLDDRRVAKSTWSAPGFLSVAEVQDVKHRAFLDTANSRF